jgi:hypothetical protein
MTKWSIVFALLVTASTAPPVRSEAKAAPEPARELAIHYIWFSAVPKAGVKTDAAKLPPVFQSLQDGWHVPLSKDPKTFLAKLAKAEPGYTYRLHLAGSAARITDGFYVISGGPNEEPLRYTVQETIRIRDWQSPTILRAERTLQLIHRAEGSTGIMIAGGHPSANSEGGTYVLGQTKSYGMDIHPSGKLTVYAISFQAGKSLKRAAR